MEPLLLSTLSLGITTSARALDLREHRLRLAQLRGLVERAQQLDARPQELARRVAVASREGDLAKEPLHDRLGLPDLARPGEAKRALRALVRLVELARGERRRREIAVHARQELRASELDEVACRLLQVRA